MSINVAMKILFVSFLPHLAALVYPTKKTLNTGNKILMKNDKSYLKKKNFM
jgi:hypothetical protein